MYADHAAGFGFLIGDFYGFLASGVDFALKALGGGDGGQHLLQGPGQVDGGGAGGVQPFGGGLDKGSIVLGAALRGGDGGDVHPPGSGGADERGAAHVHVLDGGGGLFDGAQGFDDELVGQVALVDDLDGLRVVRFGPDGAVGLSVDLHGAGSLRVMIGDGDIIKLFSPHPAKA